MHIFRILSAENFILYFGSIWIGIFAGFSLSKLCMMMLFHTVGVKASVSLFFKQGARSDVNCVRGNLPADYDDELLIY